MRLRKDVNVYQYHPSAKLFHMVVELKNVPGALESVLRVLREMNLNVLGSFSSVDVAARSGVWSGFIEDSLHTETELREKISSSQYVLDVLVSQSKEGFLVDSLHFPLAWNTGDRAVMMRAKYLILMFDRIREELGTGGETLVYQEGLAYGTETWKNFGSRIGPAFVSSNLHDVLMIYQAVGWFKLEGVDVSERDWTIRIITSGSFECDGRRSARPYSQFVRGHLTGGLTALLGKELECEETKCMAAGDQFCEFTLTPKSRPSAAVGQGTVVAQ